MEKLSTQLSLLSTSIVLLTLNRMTNVTQGHLFPYEFLRWQDFNAMLTIPLLITFFYTLLFISVTKRQKTWHKKYWTALIIFIFGVYLYGVSSGNHEVTNYLNHRYCIGQDDTFCNIVAFNDDTFSHLIFYLSTILMTFSLLLHEHFQPLKKAINSKEKLAVVINGLLIAAGIVLNLVFEEVAIDLVAFSILAIIAGRYFLKVRSDYKKYPITLYMTISYSLGMLATVFLKLIL